MHSNFDPYVFGFLLTEHFSMIAFTAALEPLRLANRAAGRHLYAWRLYSSGGHEAEASNGVRVRVDGAFRDAASVDAVVVCAGVDVQRIDHHDLISVLRRQISCGASAGAVCTGAYVLAKGGLLDGYRCTIHWENRPGLRADFPDLQVGDDLFEIDRDRFTCAGGVAAADMMLSLIRREHGEAISRAVTAQLIHQRIREAGERQRPDVGERSGIAHPKLLRVVEMMEASIDRPAGIDEFARAVALSPRQLERLFTEHLGVSPSRHYVNIRLEHARQLLKQTRLSVLDVAMASGFNSASYFSQSYLDRYGHSPRAERKAPAA
ncbi:GlxA family transcriptional regulator [Aureimonas sp. SK2]|uniref:GlxA family transcriptional regulator n=1 Tax=Aureimonas sp. SK2 TaxID=3015992 RepID=UPI00244434F3|nr:GlxA family transcriptional regulator [Aureimonas sp. SK2]